jgi:hypothetical protein
MHNNSGRASAADRNGATTMVVGLVTAAICLRWVVAPRSVSRRKHAALSVYGSDTVTRESVRHNDLPR